MLQLLLFKFNLLTTSNLLQITEFGTSYFKVFRKIVYMRKQLLLYLTIITVLNSKFNHLFHSLNITECTLGCQYISVTLYLIQTYPSGKPLFKGQGPVNLTHLNLQGFNISFYKFHLVWSADVCRCQSHKLLLFHL